MPRVVGVLVRAHPSKEVEERQGRPPSEQPQPAVPAQSSSGFGALSSEAQTPTSRAGEAETGMPSACAPVVNFSVRVRAHVCSSPSLNIVSLCLCSLVCLSVWRFSGRAMRMPLAGVARPHRLFESPHPGRGQAAWSSMPLGTVPRRPISARARSLRLHQRGLEGRPRPPGGMAVDGRWRRSALSTSIPTPRTTPRRARFALSRVPQLGRPPRGRRPVRIRCTPPSRSHARDAQRLRRANRMPGEDL